MHQKHEKTLHYLVCLSRISENPLVYVSVE